MKPSAILFDFDGVMVDSLSVHRAAWRDAVQDLLGFDVGCTRRFIGMSTKNISEMIAREAGCPDRAREISREKQRKLATYSDQIPAFEGVREVIANLAKTGTPFGIATNAPRVFVHSALKRIGINVPVVITVDDTPRPKPAPDVFVMCATALGVSPGDFASTVVFEDSCHGLEAACAAGMFPIGVTSQLNAQVLEAAGAQLTCASLVHAMRYGWFEEINHLSGAGSP